jgi:hypothetical protein
MESLNGDSIFPLHQAQNKKLQNTAKWNFKNATGY